jgi:hypothetical protein
VWRMSLSFGLGINGCSFRVIHWLCEITTQSVSITTDFSAKQRLKFSKNSGPLNTRGYTKVLSLLGAE